MDDPNDERRRVNRLPVRPEWLALRTEEIIRPDIPIVDPHHHLWDHPGNRYLFEEFLEDLNSGHDIRATVYVQAHGMYRADGDPDLRVVGETEFVNGVAAMSASGNYGKTRVCAGIVGYADLDLGSRVKRVLEAQIVAGCGRFRGIRDPVNSHPDPAARGSGNERPQRMYDKNFREGFACLEPLGLSFDGWLYHTQLREFGDLAASFPGTTFIVNHVGCPLGIGPYAGKRQEVFVEWSAAVRDIARHPNIYMKLGGLGMKVIGWSFHEAALPPTSDELAKAWKPYIETCIEAFGPSRCMFESNAPVDRGTSSYQIMWNAYKRLASAYSEDEQAAMFSGTATKVYRLGDLAKGMV